MGHDKKVVLLVDDKETNLVLLTGMLESAEYQVVTATDGVQAWDILEAGNMTSKPSCWIGSCPI